MELQRGKPAEKYLYQNMTGWQATDKGFEISMASGEHCSFSCASGEKICEAMTEKASELAKVCDFSLTFLLTLLTCFAQFLTFLLTFSQVQQRQSVHRGFSVDDEDIADSPRQPDLGKFLESKGHGAFTLRVKEAMRNTGVTVTI